MVTIGLIATPSFAIITLLILGYLTRQEGRCLYSADAFELERSRTRRWLVGIGGTTMLLTAGSYLLLAEAIDTAANWRGNGTFWLGLVGGGAIIVTGYSPYHRVLRGIRERARAAELARRGLPPD